MKQPIEDKIKTIWKDPVWSKIIAAAIITFTAWILNLVPSATLIDIYYQLNANVSTHLWTVIMTITVLALSLSYNMYVLYRNKYKPCWTKQNKLEKFGVVWRWENNGYLKFNKVEPHCPVCDIRLKFTEESITVVDTAAGTVYHPITFICPICDKNIEKTNSTEYIMRDRVERLIETIHRKSCNK